MSYVIDAQASINSPSITALSSSGSDRSTLSRITDPLNPTCRL
jgi:hypothetical protein